MFIQFKEYYQEELFAMDARAVESLHATVFEEPVTRIRTRGMDVLVYGSLEQTMHKVNQALASSVQAHTE